jgi:hypothetical protein
MKLCYIFLKASSRNGGVLNIFLIIVGVIAFVVITSILGFVLRTAYKNLIEGKDDSKDPKNDKETLADIGECFLWGLIGVPILLWFLGVFGNASPR